MEISYKVIFKTNFYSSSKKYPKIAKTFQDFKKGGKINYIARKTATLANDMDNETLKKEFLKSGLSYDEFLKNQVEIKKNSGLFTFNEKGKIENCSIDEAKKIVKKIDDEQMVWDTTLSFGNYAKEKMLFSQKEFLDIIETTLPNFFKSESMNIKNMNVFLSLHGNTGNPHAHIIFFEKNKSFLNQKTGEIVFKSKGKFNLEHMRNFEDVVQQKLKSKENYDKTFETKKEVWENRKTIKTNLKNSFIHNAINNPKILNNIKVLSEIIKEENIKNYAKMNEDQKDLIKELFLEIVNNDDELKEHFFNYQEKIELIRNNEDFTDANFLDKENEEFENQIANILIKEIIEMEQNSEDNDLEGKFGKWTRPNFREEDSLKMLLKKVYNQFLSFEKLNNGTKQKQKQKYKGLKHE